MWQDTMSALPINTAQNTDTQHVWNNTSHREFNGIFLCQCLSATFQAAAWQCFTSTQKKGLFFRSSLSGAANSCINTRASRKLGRETVEFVVIRSGQQLLAADPPPQRWRYKINLLYFKLSGGGKKMEGESTTWTGSCCCHLVISEAWSSRADLQGKSLKHIIRAEIGKLKSSVPLTHILSRRVPSSS